jgi:hypothetical protein
VYPFRDRDVLRVQRSLDSWTKQTPTNFKIYVINYGSNATITAQLEKVVARYSFVSLKNVATQYQPWNKSRALNSVIRTLEVPFCFVADIDMIFHPNFMETLNQVKAVDTITYFKVGFLHKNEAFKTDEFSKFTINFYSDKEATGMSLFPVEALKTVRGFDEFYHFWGAEDTDVHIRLQHLGLNLNYYDKEVLILHQWHPSYRSRESKKIVNELRLHNAVRLNHTHMHYNATHKITAVNDEQWGQPLSTDDLVTLENGIKKEVLISSKKAEIDHFLNFELKALKKGNYCFKFEEQSAKDKLKQQLKVLLGKPIIEHYTLKEINDLLLMAVLVRYNFKKYGVKIHENLQRIQFILNVS